MEENLKNLWAVHLPRMTVKCPKVRQVLRNPCCFFHHYLHKIAVRDTSVNLGVSRRFATHDNDAKVGRIFNCHMMDQLVPRDKH